MARSSRSTLAEALKPTPAAPAPVATDTDDHAHRAPSRRGRKAVTFYLDPAGHRQLRMITLESDRSTQSLLVEAVNDMFQKHGKPRIAG